MKDHQKGQDVEWSKAQKIAVSVDLIPAAKQLLQFLAAIDRNRHLYQGPTLDRAIHRYQNCWLPLLAKQAEFDVLEGPLVVPLDCEWIWHCHRLNPTCYKADCKHRYGRILDNFNIVSTIQGTLSKQTEEIWTRMYPDEPFQLDLSSPCLESYEVNKLANAQDSTDYDLASAVKRQSPFFYQVARPFMGNEIFLKEAVARYKGFLHLIKRNKEKSIRQFCVPTFDIDLIWHAHQLHPALYCKDTTAIFGMVLEHDDTNPDRTEGTKLDVGFMETTKQWEEVYGLRYWRAGTMYRGNAPSSIAIDARVLEEVPDNVASDKVGDSLVHLPKKMLTEVLLEIVEVKGIPEGHGDDGFVLFSKQYKNLHHTTKKKLSISSELGKKQVASFQCESTAELIFELMSNRSSTQTGISSRVTLGGTSISMTKFVNLEQALFIDSWFELSPSAETTNRKPISLRVSISFTPPFGARYVLNMVPSQGLNGSHTSVLDEACNQVIGLYMRQGKTGEEEVIGILGSEGPRILAKDTGKGWSLVDSLWDLRPQSQPSKQVYELRGKKKVIIMPGIKSDYETEYNRQEDEQNFITAVEFSPQQPYGKAVALFNLKSGFLEIKEDWFLTPGFISAYILRNILISKSGFKPTEMSEVWAAVEEDVVVDAAEQEHVEEDVVEVPVGAMLAAEDVVEVLVVAVLVVEDNVVDLVQAGPLGSSMKLAVHL
ncbi:hypothetical protein Cgig2_005819 [Carnegiea gigantea]|uniref:Glycine-rich domain-containing protein 1 n=1 Tax=Carnegiea gigantea TaxID=171969 RepID=A0A9Q1KMU7_9CARY|nr:hypothetical protein Cgig2_005819 [Carnegiea gigantea]